MTPETKRRKVADRFLELLEDANLEPPVGHATYLGGGDILSGQLILICQSNTGASIEITESDAAFIKFKLYELARDDAIQERGDVVTFANCKWAFYSTEQENTEKTLKLDSRDGYYVEKWNHCLAQVDLRQYATVNHLYFAFEPILMSDGTGSRVN